MSAPDDARVERGQCTICDPRPEATDAECDKWPGYYKGCIQRDENKDKPVGGWVCDGKGNLTRIAGSASNGRIPMTRDEEIAGRHANLMEGGPDVPPVGACPEGARELLIEADNFIDAFLEGEGALHPDLEVLHTRIVTWLAGSAPKMACLWIAVSERAPQAQFDVLVSDGRYIGIGDCCKGHLWNSTTIEGPVTHWMPLPVAPGSAPKVGCPHVAGCPVCDDVPSGVACREEGK